VLPGASRAVSLGNGKEGAGKTPALSLPNTNRFDSQGEMTMKRLTLAALSALLFLLANSGATLAQVKRVEMKIDGYLCGN
jgi:hypothetical protein